MSVKRRDLVKYLEKNGFTLHREGKKHAIYAKQEKKNSGSKGTEFRSHNGQSDLCNKRGTFEPIF